ncbi:MAG TPA: DUF6352 family protein [Paracoccaceae bacterium]|nr:DUF6352 family protein [Paracoccaceae bacterium]HMO70369.1 DUF6352 family protein [Paracoccaceae bacterium]
MNEFWVASGHHLTRLDGEGWMAVTEELILAWLARPEVVPPPEACFAERALHARLLKAPRDSVTPGQIAAMADADARENWGFLIALRDALLAKGSVEGGYLSLVRAGTRLPVVFYDQLVQLILRNALDGCDDVFTLRAAEMMFRIQRGHLDNGALLLADDELVAELEAERHVNPLGAMLAGGVSALDVLGEGNAWTYWSRSDAHTMVLPYGADARARDGLARALAAFVRHLTGLEVQVTPATRAEGVDLRWYVGLDQVGTRIGDALWRGDAPRDVLVGLFEMWLEPAALRPEVQGHPVWLMLGMGADNTVRMKPQNLITGLPLARGPEGHA